MRKWWMLVLVIFMGCENDKEDTFEPQIVAEAQLYSLNQLDESVYSLSSISIGTARFSQDGDIVQLEISLHGMTPNTSKAVHIHSGTIEVPGRHWNQGSLFASCNERSLGQVWARPFIGDVGNVPIDENGKGTFVLRTDLWKINSGDEKDVLQLPMVIHEYSEDFVAACDPSHSHNHDSNPKIGGGTVQLLSDVPLSPQAIGAPMETPDFLICK